MMRSISRKSPNHVLENGNLVLEGDSLDLLDNPDVKKAYLGG